MNLTFQVQILWRCFGGAAVDVNEHFDYQNGDQCVSIDSLLVKISKNIIVIFIIP